MGNLTEISEDLVTYLNFYIYEVEHASDPNQRAVSALAVSNYYEAVGICELLLDAETDAFFHHLIRSAQTRKWLLQQSIVDEGYSHKVLKISAMRPLFDSIAANQFGLAREIAALSSTEWYSDVEYEDDFCYAHFLHRYLLNDPQDVLIAILNRFEGVLEGMESTQLGFCKALLDRKQRKCEEAFLRLLDEREKKIKKMEQGSAYSDDALFYPYKSIFVEGLAWLRLFENIGIRMDGEYKYCPSMARKTDYAPFEVTTFPSIPL